MDRRLHYEEELMNSTAFRYILKNYPSILTRHGYACVDETYYPSRPDSICVLETPQSVLSLRIICDRGDCSLSIGDKRHIVSPKASFHRANSPYWFGPKSVYYLLHGPYDMDDEIRINPTDRATRVKVANARERYIIDNIQGLMELFSDSKIEQTIGILKHANQLIFEAQNRWIEEVQAERKKNKKLESDNSL